MSRINDCTVWFYHRFTTQYCARAHYVVKDSKPQWPELDETCRMIFQYLAMLDYAGKDPIRFNELLRSLNNDGFSISRPTLSLHLKHLVENKLLFRNEISKQNITYRFYFEKWTGFKETMEKSAKLTHAFANEKTNFLSERARSQLYELPPPH